MRINDVVIFSISATVVWQVILLLECLHIGKKITKDISLISQLLLLDQANGDFCFSSPWKVHSNLVCVNRLCVLYFTYMVLRKCQMALRGHLNIYIYIYIWHKAHESMYPSCLVSTVQAAGDGVMVWGIISWHILGPLVPIEHHLNTTAYLSIVADHVHPFMTTVYLPIFWWIFPAG